ncbi:MAG: hypothetical protein IPM53_05680 [Anaerolineaceae bacterium]|nr:hypothetical protein [Anaerolineaceae bacterium]
MMLTKQIACLFCLAAGLWLRACHTPEPSPVQLDQSFTISINQPAQFAEKGLSLTFQDVLEDSRCPSNVQCAWAGQARISIRVSQTGQAPATLEMNTNPPLEQDVVTYGDFQIQLLALDPYPEEIGQHIPAKRYEATFLVTDNTPEPSLSTPLPPSEAGGTLSIQLDQPFAIPINQPAQLSETGLSLTFQEVLEESRCPSNVQCAEAGQARISIRISQADQAPVTLEMNTNPPLKLDVVTYGDFQIQLLALDPYPEEIGQHIPAEAYEATFVVTERP